MRALDNCLGVPSFMSGFADDIGIVSADPGKEVCRIASIFVWFQACSGLELGLPKCFAVPLFTRDLDAARAVLTEFERRWGEEFGVSLFLCVVLRCVAWLGCWGETLGQGYGEV